MRNAGSESHAAHGAHTFEVWAPAAERLDVETGSRRVPMTRDGRGWWTATVPDAARDGEYRFAVDDGEPLPDPRSTFQPHPT